MIAHLSGVVLSTRDNFLVLDVSGVGYKVFCTQRVLDSAVPRTDIGLHTHLAVREDALDLFGFPTVDELKLFQMLIGISGIGPRSALGIIGLESIERLVGAIAHGDVGYLTKVSGVGKKSAEKIVLELKDKVTVLDIHDIDATRHEDEDVLEALIALGYRGDEARDALRTVPPDVTDQSDRIKAALRELA